MKNKKSIQFGLAVAVLGGVLTPVLSHAEEVSTPPQSTQSTQVVGTFEATTLDVSIPAVSTFLYNPNTEEMNAQQMNMKSNTNAPVYMTMKGIEISPESTWKPSLVTPDKYDAEQWRNLTKSETLENVSLGLHADENENFLTGILNNDFFSTDIADGKKVGVLKANQAVDVIPTLKAGTALDTQQILTANYVFEFGLE